MEERQGQQHPVHRRDRRGAQRGGLRAVGQQRAVREPDARAAARWCRRCRRAARCPRRRGAGAWPAGRRRSRPPTSVGGGGAPWRRPRRPRRRRCVAVRGDHDGPGGSRPEHDVELPARPARAVRHGDRARPQRPEHGDAERGAVPAAATTTRSPAPAPASRSRGGLRGHGRVELRPGQRRAGGDVAIAGVLRPAGGGARDEVGDVHGHRRHVVGAVGPTARGGNSARCDSSATATAFTTVTRQGK